jgi:signal transduction histidine kinase
MVGLSGDEGRLARLLEAGRALVSELDVEVLLERLLATARELTGARYAALGILDEHRRELERFVTQGIDTETRRAIGPLPRGRGILGVLIDEPRPLRLADLSEHPRSFGFPAGHPPMGSFLGVPVLIRGKPYGNLYLTEKEGGEFDEDDEEALTVLADWAAIAIDNARLYADAQQRRDELERAVQSLEATTAIALAVGGETELDRVLELIVKRARALVEARGLALLLERGDELEVAATAGELAAELRGARVSREGSVGGEVMASREPERLGDTATRVRFSLGALGVRADAGLFVPMVYRGRSVGVIEAFDRLGDDPRFRAEDERLMSAFAASAATAVATAQFVEEDRLRHSIQSAEQERRRWARELHDETLQGLAAIRVLLSAALRQEEPEAVRSAATTVVDELSDEIEKLRGLITELRPAALDELGLEPALEALMNRAEAVEGLKATLRYAVGESSAAPARLRPDLESTIYRLVQEALTNVAKHAGANNVEIDVRGGDDTVEVTVADDGAGFDPDDPTSGFGLVGMRERVALAEGVLDLESRAGEGTRLHARFPVAAAEGGAGRIADAMP